MKGCVLVLVRDIMTIHPVYIMADASLRRAAEIVSLGGISDLMVVEKNRNLVGVISEGDMLRALLPNYEEVLAAGETLSSAFQYFVEKGRMLADDPITPLIIRDCITINPNDEAAKAASIMIEKQIRRLPVVEKGKLAGTISRADICRAVIYYAPV